MNDQSPPRLLPLMAFTSVSMIAALAGVLAQWNRDFIFCIVVMLVLIGVVMLMQRAATLSAAMLFAVSGVSQAQDVAPPPSDSKWQLPAAIRYESLRRTTPRPLRIHVLRIDLTSDAIALAVGIGKDPDGAGPVEALLTPPSELANGKGMCAAINTNAWTMFPDPSTGKNPGYIAGGRADIKGWVFENDGQRSNKEDGYLLFAFETLLRPQQHEVGVFFIFHHAKKVSEPGPIGRLAATGCLECSDSWWCG